MKTELIGTTIVETLQKAGHIAYFAGGWVRDFLLNVPSDDIDIATSASVEQIQSLFPKTIPVGIAFGIVIVVKENHSFEVATFRKEQEYIDGRRPTRIEPAQPQEDAQRRDFTINGLFFDPISKTLFDFVGGQEDLKKKVLRAIGDPHLRFLEDRLRMIRAARYAIRFNFEIDCDTEQAILSHAASLFPSVAMERVCQEFQKMSHFARFDQSILLLHHLKLLPIIFPQLKNISLEELKKRVAPLPHLPKPCPLIAELLFLFPDNPLEDQLDLCDYLKLSRQDKEIVSFLHKAQSLLLMPFEWQSALENIEWAYLYANPLCSLALTAYLHQKTDQEKKECLHFHEQKRKTLLSYIERIQTKKPLIRAEDLQKEGILPGIQMGKLLKEAEKISINEQIEDKQKILSKLKKQSLW